MKKIYNIQEGIQLQEAHKFEMRCSALIKRHHFIQRTIGPDSFLQILGEFRSMHEMLKF